MAAPYPYASTSPPSAHPTPRTRCPAQAPPQSAPPFHLCAPPSPTNTQTENPQHASRSPSPTRYPPSPASTQKYSSGLSHLSQSHNLGSMFGVPCTGAALQDVVALDSIAAPQARK